MEQKRLIAAFSALGQETRLAVFHLLVERGPDGLSAGEIADELRLPPSSLTFHLQQLTHAGLIAPRRLSRKLIYAANFALMNDIVDYLTQNCCGGNPELCMPKAKPAARKGRRAA